MPACAVHVPTHGHATRGCSRLAVHFPLACLSMQGKRADGRSSAAAPSPSKAAAALQALLTCEGLERDADVEAELAHISTRQQQRQQQQQQQQQPGTAPSSTAAAAQEGRCTSPRSGGGGGDRRQDASAAASGGSASGAAATRAVLQLDAARSTREQRRDQDQQPRPRSRGGSTSSTPGGRATDQAAPQRRRSIGGSSAQQVRRAGGHARTQSRVRHLVQARGLLALALGHHVPRWRPRAVCNLLSCAGVAGAGVVCSPVCNSSSC
jgi:hypothetical protein